MFSQYKNFKRFIAFKDGNIWVFKKVAVSNNNKLFVTNNNKILIMKGRK